MNEISKMDDKVVDEIIGATEEDKFDHVQGESDEILYELALENDHEAI